MHANARKRIGKPLIPLFFESVDDSLNINYFSYTKNGFVGGKSRGLSP
jgi:hypothetical protein